jgi:hypothetical protein
MTSKLWTLEGHNTIRTSLRYRPRMAQIDLALDNALATASPRLSDGTLRDPTCPGHSHWRGTLTIAEGERTLWPVYIPRRPGSLRNNAVTLDSAPDSNLASYKECMREEPRGFVPSLIQSPLSRGDDAGRDHPLPRLRRSAGGIGGCSRLPHLWEAGLSPNDHVADVANVAEVEEHGRTDDPAPTFPDRCPRCRGVLPTVEAVSSRHCKSPNGPTE